MERTDTPSRLRDLCWDWRLQGLITALVPTMGYLHEGHLSLVSWARQNADKVVVSLFVNPTQFGPGEDLETYPRNLERDTELAAQAGADLLFTPTSQAMYEPGHATWVEVPELAQGLCGASRPIHFRGVATVVTKLLLLALPSVAVFGEKDFQQLVIIKRLARDLNIPTRITGRPIVREPDGLAMSSRNVNLEPQERRQAPEFHKGLQLAQEMLQQGETDTETLGKAVQQHFSERMALAETDYLAFVDPESLAPVKRVSDSVLLAGAVRFSKVRLIDNLLLQPSVASLASS